MPLRGNFIKQIYIRLFGIKIKGAVTVTMNEEKAVISARALRKSFQGRDVLKDVSFFVPQGIIYTLLGSNGAGKTTTIKILTAQLKADGGKAYAAGYDVAQNPRKVHENISLTGQFSAVDEALTGKENLVIMGKLRKIASPEKRACELLEYFELSAFANKRVLSYSGGMKRKLDIAMSLIGNPKIIFLDEPTTGLDPQSRLKMWKLLKELKQSGVTIFLTTQYLDEAEQLSDKIAILDGGIVAAEGTPKQLKRYLPKGAAEFLFQCEKDLTSAEIVLKDYKLCADRSRCKLTVFTDGIADTFAGICSRLFENNVSIQDFSRLSPTLEDVFLMMINKARKEDGGKNEN